MASKLFLSDPEFWRWLVRADLWLQNLLLAITGRKFRVRKGRFGTQFVPFVPQVPWSTGMRLYMKLFCIRELWLGYIVARGVIGRRANVESFELRLEQFRCGNGYHFLKKLPELRVLRISNLQISDPTPLYSLHKLRSLELPEVSSDFGFDLSQFSELEDVSLGSWFVQARSLFQLCSLKELALLKYPGKEGSAPFCSLTKLERLWLSACGLKEIECFSALTELADLSLLLMKHIQSLHGIEQLSKLRKLRIENCPGIISLEPLRHLTSLESVRIIDCGKIESLEPLAGLPQLGKVSLSKNGRSVIVSKQW